MLLIALLGLVLYLRFADLSGWRETVAEKISQSLGRKITIAGEFKPEIGLTTRLTAGGISLANPDWCSDGTMASVRRLVVELDLWSLVSGPLTIHDIEIEDARVVLEKDADGRANWDFDTGENPKTSTGPLELALQHVLVKDVQLAWREPSRAAPLEAGIDRFESPETPAGCLISNLTAPRATVTCGSPVESAPWRVSFKPPPSSMTSPDTWATSGFRARATIKELKTLDGVDVTVDIHGDDLGDLRDLIDLPPELGRSVQTLGNRITGRRGRGPSTRRRRRRHHHHGWRDGRFARQTEDRRRHRDGLGAEHPHPGRLDRRRGPPGRRVFSVRRSSLGGFPGHLQKGGDHGRRQHALRGRQSSERRPR